MGHKLNSHLINVVITGWALFHSVLATAVAIIRYWIWLCQHQIFGIGTWCNWLRLLLSLFSSWLLLFREPHDQSTQLSLSSMLVPPTDADVLIHLSEHLDCTAFSIPLSLLVFSAIVVSTNPTHPSNIDFPHELLKVDDCSTPSSHKLVVGFSNQSCIAICLSTCRKSSALFPPIFSYFFQRMSFSSITVKSFISTVVNSYSYSQTFIQITRISPVLAI